MSSVGRRLPGGRPALPRSVDERGRLAILAVCLLVAATLAFLPDGLNRWFLPKLTVAALACLVARFVPPTGRVPRKLWVVAAIGGAVFVAASAGGDAPLLQLLGRAPRYDGLLGLGVIALCVGASARLLGPSAPAVRLRALEASVITAAVLLAIITTVETMGLRPFPSDLARPGAFLGNASDQGLLAAAFAAFLLGCLGAPATRKAGVIAGLLAAAAVVVQSGSRGAVLAFAVVSVMAGIGAIRALRTPRSRARAVGGPLALGAVVIVMATLPGIGGRLAETTAPGGDGDRSTIFLSTLALIAEHPFGVGGSGYVDWIHRYLDDTWYASNTSQTALDSPHNVLLQVVVTGGWAGALWAVLAVTVFVRIVWNRHRGNVEPRAPHVAGAGLALVALAVGLQFTFSSPATLVFGAACLGALVSVPIGPPASPSWSWAARIGTLALAVILALATAAEVPLRMAVDAVERGDVERSAQLFEEVSALRPWEQSVDDIAAQSFAYLASQPDEQAVHPCLTSGTRALARAPFSRGAADALAVCRLLDSDPRGAIDVLGPLVERSPDDPVLAFRLGLASAVAGDRDGARGHLERAAAAGSVPAAELLEQLTAR